MMKRIEKMMESESFSAQDAMKRSSLAILHQVAMETQAAGYDEAMKQTRQLLAHLGMQDSVDEKNIVPQNVPVLYFAGHYFDCSHLFLSEDERKELGCQMAREKMENCDPNKVIPNIDAQVLEELLYSAVLDEVTLNARTDALATLIEEEDGDECFQAVGTFTLLDNGTILPI